MSDVEEPAGQEIVAAREAQVAPPLAGPATILSAIVQLACDPRVDADKLDKLLAMQERMEARQAESEFNLAFAQMEAELPRIKRGGRLEYPVNKNDPDGAKKLISTFSKWEDVDAGIRPILRRHGFSLSFNTAPRAGEGGGLVVTGTLLHSAGHSRSASIPLPLDTGGGKNNLQAGASTFSYGARYTTRMLLNIVSEGDDDDGAAGGIAYVTEAQAMEVERLLVETKADRKAFMAHFKVDSLLEITVRDFPAVLNALNAKKTKQMKAAA